MPPEDLANFLFEVASPERLVILSRLSKGGRTHTELVRGLKRSGSETTRHLQRLSAAGLVTKDEHRRFELTSTARAFNAGLGLFEFLVANRDFLVDHDLSGLDARFLSRLGELGKGTFTYGEYGTVAVQESALREARVRVWMITDESTDQILPTLRERAAHGTDVRIVGPGSTDERRSSALDTDAEEDGGLRAVSSPRVFLLVVDDRAGICFPLTDGTMDRSTMLTLHDSIGLRWAEDLFLDQWSQAASSRDLPMPSLSFPALFSTSKAENVR